MCWQVHNCLHWWVSEILLGLLCCYCPRDLWALDLRGHLPGLERWKMWPLRKTWSRAHNQFTPGTIGSPKLSFSLFVELKTIGLKLRLDWTKLLIQSSLLSDDYSVVCFSFWFGTCHNNQDTVTYKCSHCSTYSGLIFILFIRDIMRFYL